MTDLRQCRTHPETGELMVAIQGLKKAVHLNDMLGYIECKVGVDEHGEAVYAVRLRSSEGEVKQFRFQNLRPVLLNEDIGEGDTDSSPPPSVGEQAANAPSLINGAKVVITGLKKKVQNNGMRGTVTMTPEKSGEEGYVVELEHGLVLRFLAKNLIVLDPAMIERVQGLATDVKNQSGTDWTSILKIVRAGVLGPAFVDSSAFQLSYFDLGREINIWDEGMLINTGSGTIGDTERKRVVVRNNSAGGGATVVCYERISQSGHRFLRTQAALTADEYQVSEGREGRTELMCFLYETGPKPRHKATLGSNTLKF